MLASWAVGVLVDRTANLVLIADGFALGLYAAIAGGEINRHDRVLHAKRGLTALSAGSF